MYMLQFIKSWFSGEVQELLFSVAKHEFNSCYYNILDFFALRQPHKDFMSLQTIDLNLQTSQTSKNKLKVTFTYAAQHLIPLCLIALSSGGTCIIVSQHTSQILPTINMYLTMLT